MSSRLPCCCWYSKMIRTQRVSWRLEKWRQNNYILLLTFSPSSCAVGAIPPHLLPAPVVPLTLNHLSITADCSCCRTYQKIVKNSKVIWFDKSSEYLPLIDPQPPVYPSARSLRLAYQFATSHLEAGSGEAIGWVAASWPLRRPDWEDCMVVGATEVHIVIFGPCAFVFDPSWIHCHCYLLARAAS